MTAYVPVTPDIDDGMFIGTINVNGELQTIPDELVTVYPLDDTVWIQSVPGEWVASGNDKVVIDNTDSGNYYLGIIFPINQTIINQVHFRLIASGEGITSSDDFSIQLKLTDSGGLGGTLLGDELIRFPAGNFNEQQFAIDITPTAPAQWLYAYIFTRYHTGKITMWNAEVFQDGDTQKPSGWWQSIPIDLIEDANIPISTGEITLQNVAFKYGDISNVDDMGSVDYSIEKLSDFDVIVTHEPGVLDTRSTAVINALISNGVKVYGYAQAGSSDAGEIPALIIAAKAIMDNCLSGGYDGVFLDMFGYDWNVSRAQQNEMIDYAHSLTPVLKVFANAWWPQDCLDDTVDATFNSTGVATSLTTDDWVLLESFYVYGGNPGGYVGDDGDFNGAFDKYTETVSLAIPLGVKVAGLAYALDGTKLTDMTDWTNAYYLAAGLGMDGLSYSRAIESNNVDWPPSVFSVPKIGATLTTPYAQISADTYEAVTSGGLIRFIATDSPLTRSSLSLKIPDSLEVDVRSLPTVNAERSDVQYFSSTDAVTWAEMTSLTTSNRYFQARISIRE